MSWLIDVFINLESAQTVNKIRTNEQRESTLKLFCVLNKTLTHYKNYLHWILYVLKLWVKKLKGVIILGFEQNWDPSNNF